MSKNQAVLEFLATRRSRSPKTLVAPAPDRDEISELLKIASRSPDHKMLVPWRFIVLKKDDLETMARWMQEKGEKAGIPATQLEKTIHVYSKSPLAVGVVYSPKETDAIPIEEQVLATGGVCLALVNAALASGWGAGWVTGWASFHRGFGEEVLGLKASEYVAGFVHIGTQTIVPEDRKRPQIEEITQWGLS